jgi:hypothetical protein
MNNPSFNNYVNGLRPTFSGVVATLLCLFIIPFFADLFIVAASFRNNDSITLILPLLNGYLKALPLYFIYLLAYFFILNTWNFIIKKTGLETFYFRS